MRSLFNYPQKVDHHKPREMNLTSTEYFIDVYTRHSICRIGTYLDKTFSRKSDSWKIDSYLLSSMNGVFESGNWKRREAKSPRRKGKRFLLSHGPTEGAAFGSSRLGTCKAREKKKRLAGSRRLVPTGKVRVAETNSTSFLMVIEVWYE
ncbi:hypothetical protein ACLOJK_030335 [Asimina triloba]